MKASFWSPGISRGLLAVNLVVLAIGVVLLAVGAIRLTHPNDLDREVAAYQQAGPCPPGAPSTAVCYTVTAAQVTGITEQPAGRNSTGYVYWLDLMLPTGAQRVYIPACGCRLTSLQAGDQIAVYFWQGHITAVRVPSGHVLSTDQNPVVRDRSAHIWDVVMLGIGILLTVLVIVPRRPRRYTRSIVR